MARVNPTQLILDRLDGAGLRPYPAGSGFRSFCPSHDDVHTPSLQVDEGDDGRVLLYCRAGCHAGDVAGELGLRLRDLFPARDRQLAPVKPKLVPVAGGGMATRAQRDIIERETAELVRQWADNWTPPATRPASPPVPRDWDRMWAILADQGSA